MAGTLEVQTIQGPSSGANANKVIIPSGHTLDASGGTLVPSAGAVVQTVQQPYTSTVAITSTSYTATGLSSSITPTSSSSKILVLVNLSAEMYQNGAAGGKFYLQILRGSTEVAFRRSDSYAGTASNNYYSFSIHGTMAYLDTPSTTSAVTYSVNGKLSSTQNNTNLRLQDAGSMSTLTLMEIAQ